MPGGNPEKFSPMFFAFALFCFLLPFATVSCPGGQATLSGYHLVVGTEIQGEKVSGDILAVVAFLLTLLGLALSFAKEKEGFTGAGVAGGAAALALLVLQSKMSKDVADGSGGLATVSYEVGYWLAVMALAGGAAFSFYLLSRTPSREGSQSSAVAETQDGVPAVEGVPGRNDPGSA